MRRLNGTYVDTFDVVSGGADGGGWTTGGDIAPDGREVCRTDTGTAYYKEPDGTWQLFHRFGENVDESEYDFKVPNIQYEIALSHSNTDYIYSIARGCIWKSTDFGETVSKLTTYQGGVPDLDFMWPDADGNARIGGQHLAVDPANPNIVAFGHPTDGLYITYDGGATTISLHPGLGAPLNTGDQRRGVNIAFDKGSAVVSGETQTVIVGIPGRGVYKSTTGLNGTFTQLAGGTGGPTLTSSIAVHNGRVYVCGQGINDDSQLHIHDGTVWSTPSGITGMSVTIKPDDPTKVICARVGGGMWYSTDTGANWTLHDIAFAIDADDVPWLGVTETAYMALGRAIWHTRSGVNRLRVYTGLGSFYFDNPPRTASTPRFQSDTLGIKQLLIMNSICLPDGARLIAAQDRPVFRFDPGKLNEQASWHGPDHETALRMGLGLDYAADNPDWVVCTYAYGDEISISENGGRENTWFTPPVVPTFVHSTDGTINMFAGNVAVCGEGEIIWVSSSGGPMKYTLDGGATWNNPVFGASVDMSNAVWNFVYHHRRHILVSIKDRPGEALIYCVGQASGSGTTHDNQKGIWKTTNSGANWTRIRSSHIVSHSADFYHCKLRAVPGNPDHVFWVTGSINNYPTAPSADGLFFSLNQGANFTTMTGWNEVEDIAFEKNPTANTYPRLIVKGWRGGVTGRWYCDDFNPASPTAATWTFMYGFPGGRHDENCLLFGDPNRVYGGLIDVPAGGGFFTYGSTYRARAT